MPPSREDDPATAEPRSEPVPGTAHAVREVDVLPDGRRITWYATSPGGEGSA